MPSDQVMLPPELTVFERGWLSSNSVLLTPSDGGAVLIDTGYVAHEEQTVALVSQKLGGRPLRMILNTHLHSDHCGGNAALQAAFPGVRTCIPPGQWNSVQTWDPVALTYTPTGQRCPRFRADGVVRAGDCLPFLNSHWEVHAAPGHDPHSVVLFEPVTATLISADALWESGFGVVFPELEGREAFSEVSRTLDLIERLSPRIVIPGHGAVFTDAPAAIGRARARLRAFESNPARHAHHASKVLLKFKLLEWQSIPRPELVQWVRDCTYLQLIHARWFYELPISDWVDRLLGDLVQSSAARIDGATVVNF